MPRFSDKDLDRMSREAAEHLDVPASTAGWDELETRLNEDLPLEGVDRRRRYLLFFTLLLFISTSGLIWSEMKSDAGKQTVLTANDPGSKASKEKRGNGSSVENPTTNATEENGLNVPSVTDPANNASEEEARNVPSVTDPTHDATEEKARSVPSVQEAPPNPEQSAPRQDPTVTSRSAAEKETNKTVGQIPNSSATTSATEARTTPVKPRVKTSPAVANAKPGQPSSVAASPTGTTNTDVANAKPGQPLSVAASPTGTTNTDAANPKAGQPAKDKNKNTSFATDSANPMYPSTPVDSSSVKVPAPASKPKTAANDSISGPAISAEPQAKITRKAKEKINGRFSISVLAGPDLTHVNRAAASEAGFNIGATAQLQITKRFAIQTGVIYTKKSYTAHGNDFHPPKDYWLAYVDLKKVEGSCWMLDIPVNIRYDIVQSRRGRVFASAGVSSYIMTKEDYDYYYYYNSVNSTGSWLNKTGSTDLFSVGNVSAGYERMIGRNVSFQLEPYFKVPLRGVGFGKIDLSSYGLYLSMRYSFR
jgi:hypothetical protein